MIADEAEISLTVPACSCKKICNIRFMVAVQSTGTREVVAEGMSTAPHNAVSILDEHSQSLTENLTTMEYDAEELLTKLKAPLDILIVRVRIGDLEALEEIALSMPQLAIQPCERRHLLEGAADRPKMWRGVMLRLLSISTNE